MKKLLFIAVISVVALASCTKAGKLNRKLDGKWNAVSYDGQAMATGQTIIVEFDKDKKDNGTYTMTSTYGSFSATETGTYQLTKDDVITLTSGGDVDAMTVNDYSKTDLTITDGSDIIVFKKM